MENDGKDLSDYQFHDLNIQIRNLKPRKLKWLTQVTWCVRVGWEPVSSLPSASCHYGGTVSCCWACISLSSSCDEEWLHCLTHGGLYAVSMTDGHLSHLYRNSWVYSSILLCTCMVLAMPSLNTMKLLGYYVKKFNPGRGLVHVEHQWSEIFCFFPTLCLWEPLWSQYKLVPISPDVGPGSG